MPLSLTPDWTSWSHELAAADDTEELSAALAVVAMDMTHYLGRGEISHLQWKRLGLHAVAVEMTASGACSRDGGEPVVLVNANDDPRRQRFTVAHELGHLLLDEARSRLQLGRRDEERLCNKFASELLVPRADIATALAGRVRLEPDDLIALCNRFGVTLQPILIALRHHLPDYEAIVVAREAGHPRRPAVLDFRFHASAGTSIYIPRHQRLRSAGLNGLADWAQTAGESYGTGDDISTFPLRRTGPTRSGVAHGSARWSARLMPNGLLVACIDARAMRFEWRPTRAKLAA
jgi:hypothetical protein